MALTPTSIGTRGTFATKTAGTTSTVTASGAIPAGTLLVLSWVADNTTSTTAPTLTCSTEAGTWTQVLAPVGSSVTTTAGNGIWLSVFTMRTTTAIASGAALTTVTSNQSNVARAVYVEGFANTSATLRGTVVSATSTGGTPSAVSAGTALVAGDLVVGVIGTETSAAATGDTDTLNGSWGAIAGTGSTGGNALTNVWTGMQSKVVTATGAQTYNPTSANDTVAAILSFQPALGDTPAFTGSGALTATADRVEASVRWVPDDAEYIGSNGGSITGSLVANSNTVFGQTFTPRVSYTASQVSMVVWSGTSSIDLLVELLFGDPITGAVLASSVVPFAQIPKSSGGELTAFFSGVPLTAGTVYSFRVTLAGGTSSNTLNYTYNNQRTYTRGNLYSRAGVNGAWANSTSSALRFEIGPTSEPSGSGTLSAQQTFPVSRFVDDCSTLDQWNYTTGDYFSTDGSVLTVQEVIDYNSDYRRWPESALQYLLRESSLTFQVVSRSSSGMYSIGLIDAADKLLVSWNITRGRTDTAMTFYSTITPGEGVGTTVNFPAEHQWFRIAHQGGTLSFYTSADGLTWTLQGAKTDYHPSVVSSVARISVNGLSTRIGDVLVVDNFNITPTAPPTDFSGTAALSGSGSLTTTGMPGTSGAANLSGAGTLTTAAGVGSSGAVTLFGAGSLTATGMVVASVVLSGSGSLTASGVAQTAFSGSASLSGSGTVATSGIPSASGAAGLAGSGSLTTAGIPGGTGSVPLSGAGALSASGTALVAATGATALSGSGVLAASGVANVSLAGALSGSGALAVIGAKPGLTTTVALSGTGALTSTAKPATSGATSLSGSGTLVATARPATTGPGALTGAGTLTASGTATLTATGTVTLAGAGALSSTALVAASGTGAFSGAGALAASGTSSQQGQSSITLTGSGALTFGGAVATSGTTPLSGSGTLTSTAQLSVIGTLARAGSGALAASGTATLTATGSVALAGSGTLSSGVLVGTSGAGALSGSGALTASGVASQQGQATVPFAGSGTLAATGAAIAASGNAALAGSGTLTSTGIAALASDASFSGSGTLAASGVAEMHPTGAGQLSGIGQLTGTGQVAVAGSGALSGSGTLTSSARLSQTGSVALTGSGSLTSTGVARVIAAGSISLTGAGALAAEGTALLKAPSTFSGSGDLQTIGQVKVAGVATLTSDGTLTTTVLPGTQGASLLTGEGLLDGSGSAATSGLLDLTGDGLLEAGGIARGTYRDITLTGVLRTTWAASARTGTPVAVGAARTTAGIRVAERIAVARRGWDAASHT